MRTQDAGSQKNQTRLVGSMIAMTKAAHVVMKKYENDTELIALLTDTIALAIQCHHEASHTRRLAMRKRVSQDYGSVCSTVVSTSEFLLRNLSKFKKDITDANKLTKKMRSPSPPPLHKSGRAFTFDMKMICICQIKPTLSWERFCSWPHFKIEVFETWKRLCFTAIQAF